MRTLMRRLDRLQAAIASNQKGLPADEPRLPPIDRDLESMTPAELYDLSQNLYLFTKSMNDSARKKGEEPDTKKEAEFFALLEQCRENLSLTKGA